MLIIMLNNPRPREPRPVILDFGALIAANLDTLSTCRPDEKDRKK
jgi:hypothetical protein